MDEAESLSHTKWECKYHVVFIPKCRKKAIHKGLGNEERHIARYHVHVLISIPPRYSVSQVVGYIEGKSAVDIARVYGERKRNYAGQKFGARRYFVSTVGRDEGLIREYIREHEQEDRRLDQLNLLDRGAADRWR